MVARTSESNDEATEVAGQEDETARKSMSIAPLIG